MKLICFGQQTFEIGILLRESMFINGITTNAEIWYNWTKKDTKELEKVDKMYLEKLLEIPNSTPHEGMYLELGLVPICNIIKGRRVKYLQYIVKRNPESMLYKFFLKQWNDPSPGYWTDQVKVDLKDLKMNLTLEEIKNMKDEKFQKIVNVKLKEYTLFCPVWVYEHTTKVKKNVT